MEDKMRSALQVSKLNIERQVSTEVLVQSVRNGDAWAMETLYLQYVDKITGIAGKLLRNSADVEDAVQDTFVHAFRDIAKLRETAYLERWLVQIVVHRAQYQFRIRQIKRRFGLDRSFDDERLCDQIGAPSTQEACAELALLDAAFDKMKLKDRTCFVLRYLEGYGLEETAAAVQSSLATVKRRLTRAKKIVERHVGGGRRG